MRPSTFNEGEITMRKMLLVLLFASMLSFNANPVQAKRDIPVNDEKSQLIYSFLIPSIMKGINNYYGEFRQFDNPEFIYIKNLKPGGYGKFEVKLKVETFVGAHNPPYNTEVLTFLVENDKITQIEYLHNPG